MKYTIELEEAELKKFLEFKESQELGKSKIAGHSYVWDWQTATWIDYKHTFNTKYQTDIMSDELLKTLGYHREQTYKPIPNDPNFKLGGQ